MEIQCTKCDSQEKVRLINIESSVIKDSNTSIDKYIRTISGRCMNCGQGYKKALPEDIIIE